MEETVQSHGLFVCDLVFVTRFFRCDACFSTVSMIAVVTSYVGMPSLTDDENNMLMHFGEVSQHVDGPPCIFAQVHLKEPSCAPEYQDVPFRRPLNSAGLGGFVLSLNYPRP